MSGIGEDPLSIQCIGIQSKQKLGILRSVDSKPCIVAEANMLLKVSSRLAIAYGSGLPPTCSHSVKKNFFLNE